MNFFEHQEKARRRTALLVVWFALALLGIIGAVGSAACAVLQAWTPETFLLAAAGTLVVVGLGAVYKAAALGEGGGAVARMLGGRLVPTDTRDPLERRFRNVVEEMAIASGIPVPEVFVLDEEDGVNAFAAGRSPADAAVAVTRGTLNLLNREELQGVVAHEFSHILNGDMRLNLRLLALLHGILLIYIAGAIALRAAGRIRGGRKDGQARAALFLSGAALAAIGAIGVFFSRLIQCAVSRQREYLADASAVQFTRNPGGIAGALKKIGGLGAGSRVYAPRAEEAAHLFFANGLRGGVLDWMRTHPPLEERILAIEPSWEGTFPAVDAGPQGRARTFDPPALAEGEGFLPGLGAPPPLRRIPLGAAAFAGRAGTVSPEDVAFGSQMIGGLPAAAAEAARDPFAARAVVFIMLLDNDPAVREGQLADLRNRADAAVYREMARLLPEVGSLGPQAQIPLLDLCLPALRRLSRAQFEAFAAVVEGLSGADRKMDLFEFMLRKVLLRHLRASFGGLRPPAPRFFSPNALAREASALLSSIAHYGGGGQSPEAALRAGAGQLGLADGLPLLDKASCTLGAVDAALDRLSLAAPAVKRRILEAAAAAAARDGTVTRVEAELLRAIAAALDLPAPRVG